MENLSYLNDEKPFLTISLLTSNRASTIEKCLDSLTHLRNTISSELIIVDTGCNEDMLAKIRNYTDKIIKYNWKNDFADARNVQIQAASGDWFLYIDDDEWFEDTTEIEDFFLSDRWQKVDACWYLQRNYQDMAGLSYSDDLVSRMFALIQGIHFEGCIHEYFTPFSGKFDICHSFVHHYGYVFTDEKQRYQHSLRNLSLCLEELQREPTQMRWWIQTAQEYYVISEYESLIEHCQRGLQQFKNDNDYFTNRDVAGLYCAILNADRATFNHDKVMSDADAALSDDRLYPMAIATIHHICMEELAGQGKLDQAAAHALNYFKYYKQMADNEIEISNQTSYMVDETFTRRYFESACWIMIMQAISQDDTAQIKEYFEQVVWDTPELYIFDPNTIETLVSYIAEHDYDEWFISMAERLLSRDDHVEKITNIIKDYEGSKNFENLLCVFSQVCFINPYLAYLKILALDMVTIPGTMLNTIYKDSIPSDREISDSIADFYKYICSSYNNYLSFDNNFWKKLIKHNIDLNNIWLSTSWDSWQKAIDNMVGV
ncbi:MAG: glycosyltransferase [Butyrivibrio sp.]|nr:glycosyltransferase [Butyrivibrio sp.]